MAGFYLSKFGILKSSDDKYPAPPRRLKVRRWNDAYRIFYEKLNQGRTVLAFERSLKNARDSFDSHFPNSGRIGWRSENRKPSPLGKDAKKLFDELNSKSEEEIWELIEPYSDLRIKKYDQIFSDLIGVQESELEYKLGKTEGGKKIFISSKYERSPSLRKNAIEIHGLRCMVCGFNFEEFYGEWGKEFIEVHHLQPLSDRKGTETETNPKLDLTVVCANCHRMIHRKKDTVLSIQELKEKIKKDSFIK